LLVLVDEPFTRLFSQFTKGATPKGAHAPFKTLPFSNTLSKAVNEYLFGEGDKRDEVKA
jgi:hypothetical protein